jgi:MT0933-like antitoxin protein
MGFLDKLKNLAGRGEDLVEEHDEQILDGIDKAADVVDDKTNHKYSDKIDKGTAQAKKQVKKVAEEDDIVKRSGKKQD